MEKDFPDFNSFEVMKEIGKRNIGKISLVKKNQH